MRYQTLNRKAPLFGGNHKPTDGVANDQRDFVQKRTSMRIKSRNERTAVNGMIRDVGLLFSASDAEVICTNAYGRFRGSVQCLARDVDSV
jgi:hypothetical protein